MAMVNVLGMSVGWIIGLRKPGRIRGVVIQRRVWLSKQISRHERKTPFLRPRVMRAVGGRLFRCRLSNCEEPRAIQCLGGSGAGENCSRPDRYWFHARPGTCRAR